MVWTGRRIRNGSCTSEHHVLWLFHKPNACLADCRNEMCINVAPQLKVLYTTHTYIYTSHRCIFIIVPLLFLLVMYTSLSHDAYVSTRVEAQLLPYSGAPIPTRTSISASAVSPPVRTGGRVGVRSTVLTGSVGSTLVGCEAEPDLGFC